jgi:hypothetical protein
MASNIGDSSIPTPPPGGRLSHTNLRFGLLWLVHLASLDSLGADHTENATYNSSSVVAFVYSLRWKHVYRLFPNNSRLFWIHNSGFERTYNITILINRMDEKYLICIKFMKELNPSLLYIIKDIVRYSKEGKLTIIERASILEICLNSGSKRILKNLRYCPDAPPGTQYFQMSK